MRIYRSVDEVVYDVEGDLGIPLTLHGDELRIRRRFFRSDFFKFFLVPTTLLCGTIALMSLFTSERVKRYRETYNQYCQEQGFDYFDGGAHYNSDIGESVVRCCKKELRQYYLNNKIGEATVCKYVFNRPYKVLER